MGLAAGGGGTCTFLPAFTCFIVVRLTAPGACAFLSSGISFFLVARLTALRFDWFWFRSGSVVSSVSRRLSDGVSIYFFLRVVRLFLVVRLVIRVCLHLDSWFSLVLSVLLSAGVWAREVADNIPVSSR